MLNQKFKLSTIITILVCIVVLLSLLITDLLISNTINNTIRGNLEEKAKIISRTVSKSQIVESALASEGYPQDVQDYTTDIQKAADVLFVVVMDMDGIRKSHPKPEMIGKQFVGDDEAAVLEGNEHISISEGTLGKSLRAFTPVYNENNVQIGAVAVGISLENVEQALEQSHKNILFVSIFGVIVGILGAFILARYIKKILFGLEPFAIAKILEERSTMLQSVHEGIIAVDKDSNITLVNKSALRILNRSGLKDQPIGMKITDYMPTSRLDRVLQTGEPELDEEININGVTIIVNRVPLIVNNEVVGAIKTFRDKTEVNQLAEQLTGVRTYADALRAQSHEFMNRLHVILGMVKMGFYDELSDFIAKIVDHKNHEVGEITKYVKDPALAGFMMGKLSFAREENVKLTFKNESVISEPKDAIVTHELITILGNLIDNAIEALSESTEKEIDVRMNYEDQQLILEVSDTGPGFAVEEFNQLVEKGYSTKGENRGYGLYLVNNSVEKLGGSIHIHKNVPKGMRFKIEIPYEIGGKGK